MFEGSPLIPTGYMPRSRAAGSASRSNAERRRQTWELGRQQLRLRGIPARINGTTARLILGNSSASPASRTVRPIRIPFTQASRMLLVPYHDGGTSWQESRTSRSRIGSSTGRPARAVCACTRSCSIRLIRSASSLPYRRQGPSHRRRRRNVAADQPRPQSEHIPDPTAEVGHCVHRSGHACLRRMSFSCREHCGRHAQQRRRQFLA